MKCEIIHQTVTGKYKRAVIFEICLNHITFRVTLKQLYDKAYEYSLFYRIDNFNERLIGSCKTWKEIKILIINWVLHYDV